MFYDGGRFFYFDERMARYWQEDCCCTVLLFLSCFRGKIGYFGMQIVIVVLNKYLGIISFLKIASKSKWKGFLDFVKCISIVLCFIILRRMILQKLSCRNFDKNKKFIPSKFYVGNNFSFLIKCEIRKRRLIIKKKRNVKTGISSCEITIKIRNFPCTASKNQATRRRTKGEL